MEQCAKAAGTSLANAVKSQHYHVDRNDFHAIDRIWKQYMPVPPPRSSMQIKGFMVPGALTTANLITLIPDAQHQKEERSEEHTSELQSHSDLVCRLLLEKKKKKKKTQSHSMT